MAFTLLKRIQRKKKNIVLSSCTILLLLITTWLTSSFSPSVYKGNFSNKKDTFIIIAHRKYTEKMNVTFPEKIRLMEEKGLQGLDIDIRSTSDKKLIVAHDADIVLDDVNYGTFEKRTYSDISLLFNKFNKQETSFEEVVSSSINHSGVVIAEMKVNGIEKQIANTVKKYNAYDSVYVSSFNPESLSKIREYDKNIKTMLILTNKDFNAVNIAQMPWYLSLLKTILPNKNYINTMVRVADPDLLSVKQDTDSTIISSLSANGYPILIWSPNTKEQLTSPTLAKNIYGIITDNPLYAKKLLVRKK